MNSFLHQMSKIQDSVDVTVYAIVFLTSLFYAFLALKFNLLKIHKIFKWRLCIPISSISVKFTQISAKLMNSLGSNFQKQ